MKQRLDFNHFGHEHILNPLVLEAGDELLCKACEEMITLLQPFHGCLSCDYYLHDKCLNIPRSTLHPCHPNHPMTLIPVPTYPAGSITCNACHMQGQGFSYACAHCEFDVHLRCATSPEKVRVPEQHQHELKLAFESVVQDCRKYYGSFFKCGECDRPLEDDQWRYHCNDCDMGFGLHLGCLKIDDGGDAAVGVGKDGRSGTAQAVLPEEAVENGAGEVAVSAAVAKLVKYL